MINTLSQILEKKGQQYLDNFLSQELIITEKIDTYRILFENINGNIQFYKKDNNQINLIEQTLSDIYDDAILEIQTLTNQTIIPENLIFGLYYVPQVLNDRPIRIPYSNLPKYILTDVSRKENDKIVESYDYNNVKSWASLLCMARPPVIFEGKLNDFQKKKLLDYDKKEYSTGGNLNKIIEDLFGNTYSKQDIIEGIIIQSNDRLAQIISYEFDILNEAYQKNNSSRDFYDIILINLCSFMDNYNIPVLESNNSEELYLNIICDIFNNYCLRYKLDESLDIQYLNPPSFGYFGKLNKKFIKNEETLKLLEKSPIHESIFKIILSSFRKYKKPYGLLNESIVQKFNTYVYLINNYSNKFENINESLIDESRSDNIVIDVVKKRQPTDIDNMRVIASIQRTFQAKSAEVNRGKQKCAIYITTYCPFTNSQLENIRQVNNMWKVPAIIVDISNKYKIDGDKFKISDDLIKAEMKSIVDDNRDLLSAYLMIDSWNLVELFEYCRPDYEPIVLITDMGKKSEMTLQLYFEEEVMGGRINVEKDFNIGEIENKDLLSGLRSIEDNNATYFMEITPKSIHNYYDSIINEYKNWSGKVKNIIKN